MTREEAIKITSLSNPTPYPKAFVQALEALGLLKLEEPKSAQDRMIEACGRRDLSGPTIDRFCEAPDLAGLTIVEKQHGE